MVLAWPVSAAAEPLDSIKEVVERLHQCWKAPPRAQAKPMDITVRLSFNRWGAILGHPRITYETEGASDNDRLAYRIAVMETLQRCTPLPFSEGLGGAAAGRPFWFRFPAPKNSPKPDSPNRERQAWLIPKIR
jgi:hypothetical protein